MSEGGLPVVTPEGPPEGAATVAGVLLAAGRSERFGDRNKLLAPLAGEPLVRRAVGTLLAAPLSEVVIVVGHDADTVREALSDLPVTVVENPNYDEGQATSVRTGIEAVGDDADAVVFALSDMPAVAPETVGRLVAAYERGLGDALAAANDGRRGNPVLFDRRHFDSLRDVRGDVGGREILLEGSESALVESGDPGVHRDVDTLADLRDLRGEHRS
ncbi:MAG: nucleotidyltransferase family protein [Halobacteriota archaeon]|uniref:nucleotidyltransferase family protein n=1 Tax=Natronomonas sp. TaxID=2184060 RepID=UPI0039771A2F